MHLLLMVDVFSHYTFVTTLSFCTIRLLVAFVINFLGGIVNKQRVWRVQKRALWTITFSYNCWSFIPIVETTHGLS